MRWEHPYSSTLGWLRCHLIFSPGSAIQALITGHAIKTPMVIDLVNVESNIYILIMYVTSLLFAFLYYTSNISYLKNKQTKNPLPNRYA